MYRRIYLGTSVAPILLTSVRVNALRFRGRRNGVSLLDIFVPECPCFEEVLCEKEFAWRGCAECTFLRRLALFPRTIRLQHPTSCILSKISSTAMYINTAGPRAEHCLWQLDMCIFLLLSTYHSPCLPWTFPNNHVISNHIPQLQERPSGMRGAFK